MYYLPTFNVFYSLIKSENKLREPIFVYCNIYFIIHIEF